MSSVAHDLARWEAGELTFAELGTIHPAHELEDLISFEARLTMVTGDTAIPDLDGWEELAARLPDRRGPLLERLKLRVQRPVALALVGTVVSTSAAVAAVPPVRRAVVSAVTEVRQLLFGEDHEPGQDKDRGGATRSATEVHPVAPFDDSAGTFDVGSDDDARRTADRRRDRKATASADESSDADASSSDLEPTSSSDGSSSSSGSSDASSGGGSSDESSDSSNDSSKDGTDRSSDESSDSWEDEDGSGSSHDESEDCSSESDECWDGTTFDPDDF